MSQEIDINELANRYAIMIERNATERKIPGDVAVQVVFDENETNIVNNLEQYRITEVSRSDLLFQFYQLVGKTLQERRLSNESNR